MSIFVIIVRLLLAAGIGLLIGCEREHNHKAAGLKTHILVCLGAAVISLIQVTSTNDIIALCKANPELASVLKSDNGRIIAQVVSGIGFLGAGCVLRRDNIVTGLTTAATLWVTACIGIAAGLGYYSICGAAGVIVMSVLLVMHLHKRKTDEPQQNTTTVNQDAHDNT